jgi:hypothetical protein
MVYDRSTITIVPVPGESSDSSMSVIYEISIDGVRCASVRLQKYFPPALGVYPDGRCAIWGGVDIAVAATLAGPFVHATLPEPVHAIYRLSNGWIIVAEISVYVLDDVLEIVQRRIHNEVIVRSFWDGASLIVGDFAGEFFCLAVNEAALEAGDFQSYAMPMGIEQTDDLNQGE